LTRTLWMQASTFRLPCFRKFNGTSQR
jgi:hypothetical protein